MFCDRTEIWCRKAVNVAAPLEISEVIKEELDGYPGPYHSQGIAGKSLRVSVLFRALSKDIDIETKQKSFRTCSNIKCKIPVK